MGKRPTSNTKGGRRMNPADVQRKLERKKELKRNKKQRVAIRHAVLKAKDPDELIEQMQKLDQMAYDPDCPPPLAERVIDEKRIKLRQTFERVLGMYRRDDEGEKVDRLRKRLRQYDIQRQQMEQNFLAVKFAKESNPEEIPLPGGDAIPGAALTPAVPTHQIPFPSHMLLPETVPAHGILKKAAGTRSRQKADANRPPGPPAGVPPSLSDLENDIDSSDDDDTEQKGGRVRFAGVADKEKDSRTKYKKLAKQITVGGSAAAGSDSDSAHSDDESRAQNDPVISTSNLVPPPQAPVLGSQTAQSQSSQPQPLVFPGQRFTRPPPPPRAMPPGMPPHMGIRPPPHMSNMQMMQQLQHLPPGMMGPMRAHAPPPTNAAVISAAPAITNVTSKGSTAPRKPPGTSPPTAAAPKQATIIEARPQMRNMRKEVAALVPTAVRVRRQQPQHKALGGKAATTGGSFPSHAADHEITNRGKEDYGSVKPKATSGDAYDQFMTEIKDLI